MAELWDLYDENRKKLARVGVCGEPLQEEEFHLVVNAWIQNDRGEFLIAQRAAMKSHPFMWECIGTSVVFGEDSLHAAIRGIKEKLGIDINSDMAKYIGYMLRYFPYCNDILDVWLFHHNASLEEIKIQEMEVNDAIWATANEIVELYQQGKFDKNAYCEEIIGKRLIKK